MGLDDDSENKSIEKKKDNPRRKKKQKIKETRKRKRNLWKDLSFLLWVEEKSHLLGFRREPTSYFRVFWRKEQKGQVEKSNQVRKMEEKEKTKKWVLHGMKREEEWESKEREIEIESEIEIDHVLKNGLFFVFFFTKRGSFCLQGEEVGRKGERRNELVLLEIRREEIMGFSFQKEN